MKDCRNIINLVAVISVLEVISVYQKWGQLEKASAFERKTARRQLAREMKNLDDKAKVKKVVTEKLAFIDFEKKKMKNSEKKLTFVPNSQSELIKLIMKRQQQIGYSFLKHKNEIHAREDPEFLESISDVFDL